MDFSLTPLTGVFIQRRAASRIARYNEMTTNNGLRLTEQDALELSETRSLSLERTGRIEFGAGAIGKLIEAFKDSPYISQDNYVETIHELIDMFYYYKNETLDMVSDDSLVKFMKKRFDGVCGGSLELLECRELEALARKTRCRLIPHHEENR